jgi:hypothetical protein
MKDFVRQDLIADSFHEDVVRVERPETFDAYGNKTSDSERILKTKGNLQLSGRRVEQIQREKLTVDGILYLSGRLEDVQLEDRVTVEKQGSVHKGTVEEIQEINNALLLSFQ